MGNKNSHVQKSQKHPATGEFTYRQEESDEDDDTETDNLQLEVETNECLNGESEAKVINCNVDSCKNKDNHERYTPVEDLFGNASLQILPEAIRHDSVLEYIKIYEKLVVRIRTSVRGEAGKQFTYGSGCVNLSIDKLIRNENCCIRDCSYNNGQVHENYGGLIVYTNKHVIKNHLEAGCCNVDFFYYNERSLIDTDEMTGVGSFLLESGAENVSATQDDNSEQQDFCTSRLDSSDNSSSSAKDAMESFHFGNGNYINSRTKIDAGNINDINSAAKIDAGNTVDINSTNKIDVGKRNDINSTAKIVACKRTDINSTTDIDAVKRNDISSAAKIDAGNRNDINSTGTDDEITASGSVQLIIAGCVNSSTEADAVEHKIDNNDKRNNKNDYINNSNGLLKGITAYGFSLREDQENKDLVGMRIFYHDPQLFHLIKTLSDLRMSAWSKIPKEIKQNMKKYAIVISHPHGLPKKISFGDLFSVEQPGVNPDTKEKTKETIYNATTCFGSSGAPVVTGHYSYRPFVHSGKNPKTKFGISLSY
ncbi:hypothetical protein BsWGS_09520 [Bradybaena similaris]